MYMYKYICILLCLFMFQTRCGKFGFLFDIDGVIVRGKRLLPSARAAFELLIDRHGHFQVPTLFVTNAGNSLRQQKAEQLSEWLKIKVLICCQVFLWNLFYELKAFLQNALNLQSAFYLL